MTARKPIDLDDFDTAREVFYSLTSDNALTSHRSAKLLSLLCQRLVETGHLNQSELDTLVGEALR